MPGEIKHYWVGTTLMVESDAGVSGCDLKGQTGDIGPRGPQGPAGIVVDGGGGGSNNDTPTSILEVGGLNTLYSEFRIYNNSSSQTIKLNNITAGNVYTIQLTLTTGDVDTFTITIPAYATGTNGYITTPISGSKYFSQCTTLYTDSSTLYCVYQFTLKEGITADVYISGIVIFEGKITVYATTEYVDNAIANAQLGGGDYTPTTETWTFTLEDGTTVSKVVCVG